MPGGFLSREEILNFPREEQERLYCSFYSAYLSCKDSNDEGAQRNARILKEMRELWGFSSEEAEALEQETLIRRNSIIAFIDGVVEGRSDWR
jgi:hypothetical protein